MIRVYLAFHNDLGVIAAKVLRIEKFDEKEWDAAGALNKPEFQCPFVVKYLFAKQFENDVVILMSYANAKSLDVIVKNQYQFLSIPTFRALAKQLLEGLRIIHSAKLIHRDIKSENIMLHAQQGNVKAKIADFGLAKINQENQLKITSCGTPLNMAPELVNHSFYSDNKVDIWSLGVVFFQLLTHEYPIQAGGFPELQNKMAWMKRINRHAAIKDDILWDLLSKMLNFDPKQRYSAEQALQHPFFTSQQASSEISQYALQIAQSATNAQQKGETWITIYDTNATFIVPSPEIKIYRSPSPSTMSSTNIKLPSPDVKLPPVPKTTELRKKEKKKKELNKKEKIMKEQYKK
ncbi:MAG: putative SNF1A/AMP-activated protein kinase [Streblomastix strix]|uniref:Putative SNF1A/AMP-activated protein kinase n=1 Tax=Streblomastix strix TaxID=222440 RepID=A0A5J4WXY1_9EUKA|nr:MAG: putative SNF1A/AMP-activated protein kinase [Streblomastix strix]